MGHSGPTQHMFPWKNTIVATRKEEIHFPVIFRANWECGDKHFKLVLSPVCKKICQILLTSHNGHIRTSFPLVTVDATKCFRWTGEKNCA